MHRAREFSVEIERARLVEVDAPLQQCIITWAFDVKECSNRDSFFFFFFYRTFFYFKRENTANFHHWEFLRLDRIKSELNKKNLIIDWLLLNITVWTRIATKSCNKWLLIIGKKLYFVIFFRRENRKEYFQETT